MRKSGTGVAIILLLLSFLAVSLVFSPTLHAQADYSLATAKEERTLQSDRGGPRVQCSTFKVRDSGHAVQLRTGTLNIDP